MTESCPNYLIPLEACWICNGKDLKNYAKSFFFFFRDYWLHDLELTSLNNQEFWLKRCHECGFIQPEGTPKLDGYFDRIYRQNWPPEYYLDEFTRQYRDHIFTDILMALEARLPTDNRKLLDIGAQCGRFIHIASRRGWKPEGVETHPITAKAASKNSGLLVHNSKIEDLDLPNPFDAVTLNDVLEHIPAPLPVLKRAHQLLNPGGWISVKSPCGPAQNLKESVRRLLNKNYKGTIADNMGHVNHFTPKSLGLALRLSGFKEVKITVGAPELICQGNNGPDWSLPSNWIRAGLFKACRVTPLGVHFPMAFNLLAFGKKPKGNE